MIKEEFQSIVERFNKEKLKFGWKEAIEQDKNLKYLSYANFKARMKNFPGYYDFKNQSEFKYWIRYSDEQDFVERRFCKICGKFIPSSEFVNLNYPDGCSKECRAKIKREKTIQTNLNRYGCVAPIQNLEIKKKIQSENLKKYGFITPAKNKDIINKIKSTNLERYGVEFPLQSQRIHEKTIESGLQRGSYIVGSQKTQETCLKKYGKRNNGDKISKSLLARDLSDKIASIKAREMTKLTRYGDKNYNNHKKAIRTKMRNHTNGASISKFETNMIEYLRQTYPDYTIFTQYKEDRYPFDCDCYIKDLDLFIEFQGSYYHNKRPFKGTEEDLVEYEKLSNSGIQKSRIANVWRYKDTKKREIAKNNNLNFLEYWEKPYENSQLEFDPIKRWKATL